MASKTEFIAGKFWYRLTPEGWESKSRRTPNSNWETITDSQIENLLWEIKRMKENMGIIQQEEEKLGSLLM